MTSLNAKNMEDVEVRARIRWDARQLGNTWPQWVIPDLKIVKKIAEVVVNFSSCKLDKWINRSCFA